MKGLEEVHVYYSGLRVGRVAIVTPSGEFELPPCVRQVKRVVNCGGMLPTVEVTFRGRLVEHGPEEVPDGA